MSHGFGEVLVFSNGLWLALEEDYWISLMRLLPEYGISSQRYDILDVGDHRHLSSEETAQFKQALRKALDDIPLKDLWPQNGTEPDPLSTPPLVYFSGVGTTYIETLLGFLGDAFFIELTEPGTRYHELGAVASHPAKGDAKQL